MKQAKRGWGQQVREQQAQRARRAQGARQAQELARVPVGAAVAAVVMTAATAAVDVAAAVNAGVAAGAPAGNAGAGANAVGPDRGPAAAPPMAAAVGIDTYASEGPQTKDDFDTLLLPLVLLSEPKLAGKITGRLLDLPVEDLGHLLVDGDALRAKVHEAMQAPQQAEHTQQGQV